MTNAAITPILSPSCAMASSLDAFIGKLDIGARKDLSQLHGMPYLSLY